MPNGTLFIDPEWYKSPQGKDVVAVFMQKSKREPFGLLEKPQFVMNIQPDVYEYKIFVSGKTGVGKSCAIAKLSASDVDRVHSETPGIQLSTVYWPARLTEFDRVVLFKLHFWDAGDNALQRFDHMLPACKEKMDAVVFMFSFTDKSSFAELSPLMSRVMSSDDSCCKFVVGTKLDLPDIEVTQKDIIDFESTWAMKVLTVQNVFSIPTFGENSDFLNYICDKLWYRDQVLAGKMQKPPNYT